MTILRSPARHYSGTPWVHEDNAGALEILNVACNDRKPLHDCRGSDECISFVAAIRNMQVDTSRCNRFIDSNDALSEFWAYSAIRPSS